jgi:MFS family permease
VLFLLVVSGGTEVALSIKFVGALIAFLVFYLFIKLEKKLLHPIIDFALFKNRIFVVGNVSGILAFMAMFTSTILLPFYLHDIKALTPTQIGIVMSAFPIVMAIVAPLSGIFSDKIGSVILTTLGLSLITAGLVFTAYLQPDSKLWTIVFSQMLIGFGSGIFQTPNNISIMGAVPARQLGVAGGINALARNFGMTTGIAVAVAIFSYRRLAVLGGVTEPDSIQQVTAFMIGYHDAILTGAFLALIGVFLSLKFRVRW